MESCKYPVFNDWKLQQRYRGASKIVQSSRLRWIQRRGVCSHEQVIMLRIIKKLSIVPYPISPLNLLVIRYSSLNSKFFSARLFSGTVGEPWALYRGTVGTLNTWKNGRICARCNQRGELFIYGFSKSLRISAMQETEACEGSFIKSNQLPQRQSFYHIFRRTVSLQFRLIHVHMCAYCIKM